VSLYEILNYSGGGLLLLLTVIQISPIKVNPWSWIASRIGRAINREQNDKLDVLSGELKVLKKCVDEREAKDCRVRILAFGDELYSNSVRHTRERFDQIIEDINEYTVYCKEHPTFQNEKAVMTIQYIEKIYRKCLEEGNFI
jgi:hypothetical protein